MSTAPKQLPAPTPPRPKAPVPKPGNIPVELRERDQWVLWRYELRDGKWTKSPVQVANPTARASSTDPTTWGPFDEAVRVYQNNRKIVDGYGYVFSPDDPFVGCDFDNCLGQDGEVLDWVQQRISTFGNAYFEVSPSGKGLKGFVRAQLPGDGKGSKRNGYGSDLKGAIEIYTKGRFFTVTGDAWNDESDMATDFTGVLATLHAEVSAKKTRKAATSKGPSLPLDLTDEDLLRRARESRNGAKFSTLYDSGDSGLHAGDESSADMALMNMLAFWTDKDPARMERLFSGSALGLREKWTDRPDYRQRTIEEAIAYVGDTYSSHSNGKPTSSVFRVVTPPDGPADDIPSDGPSSRGYHLTDLGNAERLAKLFGDRIRYCHAWRCWFYWDDKRWVRDDIGRIYRYAKKTVQSIGKEASQIDDEDRRKITLKWAFASESRKSIEAMIALAQSEPGIPVRPEEFDTDIWSLNVQNGTIDLQTGKLRPHRREDMNTKICPVRFDAQAQCPRWDRFENEVFAGDAALVGYMNRVAGHALTGDNSVQEVNILFGDGSNGKNVFLDTVRYILGDYACMAEPSLLLNSKGESHPTGVADLQGKRFVCASETDDGKQLAESLVKRLTGDAVIKARRMRQDFFEFPRTFKILLATNYEPEVTGSDNGIWRRIRLVPFRVKFVKVDVPLEPPMVLREVPGLDTKLTEEAPGILALLVRSCLAWQRDGMSPPPAVVAATEEFRADSDRVARFIEECCEVPPKHLEDKTRVAAKKLFDAFDKWAKSSNQKPMSNREFARSVTKKGFPMEKSNSTCWRLGIRLIDTHQDNRDGFF